MKARHLKWSRLGAMAIGFLLAAALLSPALAQAPQQKPNIMLIVADDLGYGDTGPYGGGEGRGMPTPGIDRLAHEGIRSFHFMTSRAAHREGPRCRRVAFPTAAA